ncbi:sensor histidine kinase [Eubacterium limosum]|uniref:sensor histidine kinase n=1 Tax=Eubacterium limosum TaxID=1736 RepID=UPI0010640004|nr:sensor histidine kinase [Eubacterium limosum]
MRGTSLLIYGGFTVIFNLFSVFMSYDFMLRFIGLFERKKMLTAILFFLEELTLVFVSCMSYPTYKAIALVVCNSLLALFLYRKPSKMVFYYVLLFSVVIALLECLLYYVLVYTITFLNLIMPGNPWQNGLLILLNSAILFVIYQLFVSRVEKDIVDVTKGVRIFNFVLIPIFSILNIYLMLYVSSYAIENKMYLLIICDVVLIFILNIYLFSLLSKVSENAEIKGKLALYDQASDLQYRYYQEMEQKLEDSRKTVHDMKNHLQAMERLYQTGEAEKGRQYGDDLRQLLNSFSQDYYTDNRVLNIVINDKAERGRMSGVPVACALNQIDLSFMKEMDITTIFANLLDNAIEAACEAREPWTKLKADNVRDFIVISVENSMKKSPVLNESWLNSNKEGHQGYGLENVKRALEKYNGHLRIETGENTFKVSLFIPVQTEVKNDG